MADDVDPLLPARLRNLERVVRNERRVRNSWFRAITRFLDAVREAVLHPFREAGSVPQASGVFVQPSLWPDLVDSEVMPVIRIVMRETYDSMFPGGDFDADPHAVAYLRGARNRLVGVPDEVYALIVRDVTNGLDDGSSISDIAARVQERLTASGSEYWPNRAVTVARTETIGASNAGAFSAARSRAEAEEDFAPEKVWLATADLRTRESHRIADGQRQPLLEPFVVGGFPLMFPGDPTGPPGEVINCRCSLLEVAAGEELDWTDRQFQ